MSDAEREYISKACDALVVEGSQSFFANIVDLAFPPVPPTEKMSEGYKRIVPGRSTYDQFRACINYGKGVYTIEERDGSYDVYRVK